MTLPAGRGRPGVIQLPVVGGRPGVMTATVGLAAFSGVDGGGVCGLGDFNEGAAAVLSIGAPRTRVVTVRVSVSMQSCSWTCIGSVCFEAPAPRRAGVVSGTAVQ